MGGCANLIGQHTLLELTEGNLAQTVEVVLISMPFGLLFQPSAGLGLLQAALTPLGISTKALYFTLRFAELIDVSSYIQIANGKPATYDLVGEWVFSEALSESGHLVDVEGYVNDVLRGHSLAHSHRDPVSEAFIQDVINVRGKVEVFLDECLWEVANHHPKIVGFTSVFQQHTASLALAKRLKAQIPEAFVVFGGANCEDVMGIETMRQFPFVDAVVSGEGDIMFPKLVQRVLGRESFSELQGVYTRDGTGAIHINGQSHNTPLVYDMDALPFPNYDDFFQQFETSHLDERKPPRIPFESSRGCWWGERKQCTFCGLNGANLSYRSKSASRALNELVYLASKYPDCGISVTDNILDMGYFKTFIPELATRQLGLELFYEVKANLKKEQVRLLREAGITMLQPGIESLSSHVLNLMNKGVKGLQNIQLLKWCKELGIRPFWNILWGFPGESPEEYGRMADFIPLLTHLPPPKSAAMIRLDRFSPNFDHAEQLGFVNVEPYPAYRYIYSLKPEAVANLAYFFTFQYREAQDVVNYTQCVSEKIASWQKAYETSDLFLVDKGTCLLIWDLRPVASNPLTTLTGLQRVLYIACDSACTVHRLQQLVSEHFGEVFVRQDIEDLLQPVVERGLMFKEGNTYLSLAIPLGDYSPRKSVLERFHEVMKTLGQSTGGEVIIPVVDAKEVMLMD